MNLRPRTRRSAELNIAVTPLIDVILVLLIFFMVSTTFRDDTRLRVQLPQAQGESLPPEASTPIRLVIDQAGHFFFNDQAVADETALAHLLTGFAAQSSPLFIQADARTPHQAVMTALDVASHAGLNRIVFAAIHRK